MVSIIVPVYNVEKYLNQCIDSLINQTYKELQIILIDDGSSDESGKICDEYAKKDKRIEVIHKENGGLSSARNMGLKKVRGEYVAFIDSDDYVLDHFVETLVRNIEKNQADISMCGSVCMDESGKYLFADRYLEKCYIGKEIVDAFILPLKTAVWNKLFRTLYIGSNRFPEGRIHGEDLVFITSIIKRETILASSNYIGYYYIKHPNSITTGKFSNHSFDEVYCKDKSYENLIRTFPEYKEIALRWKFRSRMNILRKLTRNDINISYESVQKEYELWIKKQYPLLKKELKFKDCLEYWLYSNVKWMYNHIFKR